MPLFLATTGSLGQMGGTPWWQAAGGFLVVFGLLLVCLKILGRLKGSQRHAGAELLATWHLGPKREIQVLRLGDTVHFLYRTEGAMVDLQQMSLQEYQSTYPREIQGEGMRGRLAGMLPLSQIRVRESRS